MVTACLRVWYEEVISPEYERSGLAVSSDQILLLSSQPPGCRNNWVTLTHTAPHSVQFALRTREQVCTRLSLVVPYWQFSAVLTPIPRPPRAQQPFPSPIIVNERNSQCRNPVQQSVAQQLALQYCTYQIKIGQNFPNLAQCTRSTICTTIYHVLALFPHKVVEIVLQCCQRIARQLE